jgi:hypothetical protein
MTKLPPLGSEALGAPSEPPRRVRVNASLCNDLSLFKGSCYKPLCIDDPGSSLSPLLADLLKEYRRLDDAIVMRLNRVRYTCVTVQTSNPASCTDKCTIP